MKRYNHLITNAKYNKRVILAIAAVIGAIFVAVLWFIMKPVDESFMSDGVLRVCLDAGHGGNDPGATDQSGQRLEKDDCLNLTLAVQKHLALRWPDVEVVLTREGDTYPSLEDRCFTANSSHADLFVSIHRNSAEGSASGVEIWVESQRPKIADTLAGNILKSLDDVGLSSNRGVKYGTASNPQGDYYVNSHTDMPSCLIEMGFITSDKDNSLLDSHMDDYASAIADIIGQTLTEQ